MLFISQIVSSEYRDTLLNCFAMSMEVYAQAKIKNEQFPTLEEWFLSFLFNMLENSYNIRQNTEDLIIYSNASDYVNWAKALGGLFNDLAYFEYDVVAASTEGVYMQLDFSDPPATPKQQFNTTDQLESRSTLQNVSNFKSTKSLNTDPKDQNFHKHLSVQYDDYLEPFDWDYLNLTDDMVLGWDIEQPPFYNFTITSVVQGLYGWVDGQANAFPKKGLMQNCSLEIIKTKFEFLNFTEHINNRELIPAMDRFYNLLGSVYPVNFYCYYGYTQFFNEENLEKLWTKRDLAKNIIMNTGSMYTDIMMLYLGVPGFTESDYAYYLMFYIGDLLTRFFFRSDVTPEMCWLPWNADNCVV